MADEPKPDQNPPNPPAPAPANEAANISPAPGDVTEGKPGDPATADPEAKPGEPEAKPKTMQAEPLSDGTVPTVLSSGSTPKKELRGRSSITSIYRRADILTTILTFVGAIVAAAVIFGIYAYFTRSKAPSTVAPKVTSLDKTDLAKLNSFFDGNTAGSSAEVLTINSSVLFKNRVAVGSDLKVTGGLAVSATTALSDLTVDKTTTLGVTNVRGQLVVAGPVNFQSPAQFGAGSTTNGNLSVTGNGSFGGSISAGTLNVRDLSVAGTISLAGHLSISGQPSNAAAMAGAGSGATATIDGNDTSGTVTVNTGTVPNAPTPYPSGQLVNITFKTAYPRVPHVIITPIGQAAGSLQFFIVKTADGFTIGTDNIPASATGYSFDYWVVQ